MFRTTIPRATLGALLAGLAVAVTPVHAALFIDSANFGPVVENFQSFDNLITSGPQTLGGGVTLSSTIASTVGANVADLGDNGTWGINRFAGIGDSSNSVTIGDMTLALSTPSYGVGALMNYYRTGTETINVAALNSIGGIIEQHAVTINSPGEFNFTLFVGIAGLTQDVSALRISGDGFVVDEIRLATAPVPEPGEFALMAAGLGVLGMYARRRKRAEIGSSKLA